MDDGTFSVPEKLANVLFKVQLLSVVETHYKNLRELAKSHMHEALQGAIGRISPISVSSMFK